MRYQKPPDNKSAVRRAGRRIAEGIAHPDDEALIDQWRSAHGYVINNFQAWMRGHLTRRNEHAEFAQRLKRRNTVIGKLRRKNKNNVPLIKDVTAMHDFAGCRVIFHSINDLYSFRAFIHSSAVSRNVEHELRHELDKYDYIKQPKQSGYRGIHDVYRHFPRGTKRQESKKPWDGLLVEIQYRTRAQHAWATAVEISDILDNEQTKFELDTSERGRFFALASEVIARKFENVHNAFEGVATEDLESELEKIERQLQVLRRLELLKREDQDLSLKEHNVLSITLKDGSPSLDVKSFPNAAMAIQKATELEQSGESVNAVYVRSDNPAALRSAYRNYFNDPVYFVRLIRSEVN